MRSPSSDSLSEYAVFLLKNVSVNLQVQASPKKSGLGFMA